MKNRIAAQELEPVAKEILAAFESIAAAAERDLKSAPHPPADVFANTSNSTFISSSLASTRIADGHRQLVSDAEKLRREPAIARVSFHDGEKERISYVCRATPSTVSDLDLVSQRAPKGRLAALPIGGSMTAPNGKVLTVLARVEVHPEGTSAGWDSKDSIFRLGDRRALTVESLVLLLGIPQDEAEDLLTQILADEQAKDLVLEGKRRTILTSMELRDQAILDAEQDEIFRLPLDEQIFLSGPPGTGKTTTLIRRLGQKLDVQYLNEDERRRVQSSVNANGLSHSDSWILFTPTELLRQYVKEAFAREGIPASDFHIRTWEEFRRDASRNVFRILKSAVRRGFVLRPEAAALVLRPDQIRSYFADFDVWQRQQVFEAIKTSAAALSRVPDARLAEIGKLVITASERDSISVVELILTIERRLEQLRSAAEGLRKAVNAPIDGALNQRLNRERGFAQELADYLQQSPINEDAEADDASEDDDEDEVEYATGAKLGVIAYRAALRALARSRNGGRKIPAGTRNGIVLERIGTADLSTAQLVEVAEALSTLGHSRVLLTAIRRYVFEVPGRYRIFRRTRIRESKWFFPEVDPRNEINEVELDVLLLSSLKIAHELLSRVEVMTNIQSRFWSMLEPVLGLYRNQVLVDEATDFSVLQLACTTKLVKPGINSFFASGDFNQRLAPTGIASVDDVRWCSASIKFKVLSVLFRQSKRLQRLSDDLLQIFEPNHPHIGIPSDISGDEVAPVLLEGHANLDTLAEWLAQRSREIERLLGQMPSLAVFVPDEASVEPLAAALNVQFRDDSLRAVACVKGQIKGQDTDLRVFDVST